MDAGSVLRSPSPPESKKKETFTSLFFCLFVSTTAMCGVFLWGFILASAQLYNFGRFLRAVWQAHPESERSSTQSSPSASLPSILAGAISKPRLLPGLLQAAGLLYSGFRKYHHTPGSAVNPDIPSINIATTEWANACLSSSSGAERSPSINS